MQSRGRGFRPGLKRSLLKIWDFCFWTVCLPQFWIPIQAGLKLALLEIKFQTLNWTIVFPQSRVHPGRPNEVAWVAASVGILGGGANEMQGKAATVNQWSSSSNGKLQMAKKVLGKFHFLFFSSKEIWQAMDGRDRWWTKIILVKKCTIRHLSMPANPSQRIWEIQYSKKKISSLHKRFSEAG